MTPTHAPPQAARPEGGYQPLTAAPDNPKPPSRPATSPSVPTEETPPRSSGTTEAPTRSLAKKLARVMGKVGNVEKKGYNDHFKYRFVQEADLADAVRPLLADEGVMFLVNVDEIETVRDVPRRSGGMDYVTRLKVTARFIDGDSGEEFTNSIYADGIDGQDKGPYKALTGAVKYLLMKTFLIGTGDDPEHDRGQEQPGPSGGGRPPAGGAGELKKRILAGLDAIEAKTGEPQDKGRESIPERADQCQNMLDGVNRVLQGLGLEAV